MKNSGFLSLVSGMLTSLLISVAAVMVFSLVILATNLPSGVITPVNLVIKLISLFVGIMLGATGGKGVIKGVIFGLCYFVLSEALFALIAGGVKFDLSLLLNAVYCAVCGGVSGVVAVNVKNA